MFSNKRLIINKNFTKPGQILHTANCDQFVTIKSERASTDDADVTIEDANDRDMFRISVGEDLSIWVTLKSVKDGILLKDFPVSQGESVRVSASANMLGKFVVFGYFGYTNE